MTAVVGCNSIRSSKWQSGIDYKTCTYAHVHTLVQTCVVQYVVHTLIQTCTRHYVVYTLVQSGTI